MASATPDGFSEATPVLGVSAGVEGGSVIGGLTGELMAVAMAGSSDWLPELDTESGTVGELTKPLLALGNSVSANDGGVVEVVGLLLATLFQAPALGPTSVLEAGSIPAAA